MWLRTRPGTWLWWAYRRMSLRPVVRRHLVHRITRQQIQPNLIGGGFPGDWRQRAAATRQQNQHDNQNHQARDYATTNGE